MAVVNFSSNCAEIIMSTFCCTRWTDGKLFRGTCNTFLLQISLASFKIHYSLLILISIVLNQEKIFRNTHGAYHYKTLIGCLDCMKHHVIQ